MDKLDLSKVTVQTLFNDDPIDNLEGAGSPKGAEADEGNPEEVEEEQEQGQEQGQEQESEESQDNGGEGEEAGEENQEGKETGDDGEGNEDRTMFQELQERLGYEIDGEFKEDYEGLVDFTKKVAEKLLEEQFNDIANAYPDVAQYISFRENGGKPKEFFQSMIPEVNFESLEIKETDEKAQVLVVSELLRSQGFTPEEINETVEDFKDSNILYKQAVKAKPKLAKAQADQRTAVFQQKEQERIERDQKIQQYWQKVDETVKLGVVQGFVIPEADKRTFFEWMARPVDKQGNTQRNLTRKQMDVEQIVAMDYLIYKGFDLNKLVQNKKFTQQANNLRNRLNKSTSVASVRMKSGGQTSSRGVKLPGLNELF